MFGLSQDSYGAAWSLNPWQSKGLQLTDLSEVHKTRAVQRGC